jgi:hypothetical protein
LATCRHDCDISCFPFPRSSQHPRLQEFLLHVALALCCSCLFAPWCSPCTVLFLIFLYYCHRIITGSLTVSVLFLFVHPACWQPYHWIAHCPCAVSICPPCLLAALSLDRSLSLYCFYLSTLPVGSPITGSLTVSVLFLFVHPACWQPYHSISHCCSPITAEAITVVGPATVVSISAATASACPWSSADAHKSIQFICPFPSATITRH